MTMEESHRRPCHYRSNSSPTPHAEPWTDAIPSSPSMILPCGSDLSAMCGIGQALESMIYHEMDDYDAGDDDEEANEHRAATIMMENAPVATAGTTTPSLPTKSSFGSQDGSEHFACAAGESSRELSPPPSPIPTTMSTTPVYQKRGRFTIWPVTEMTADAAIPKIGFSFFGVTPQ